MKLKSIEAMTKVNYFGINLLINPDCNAIACDIDGNELLIFAFNKNAKIESSKDGFFCSIDNDLHKIFLCTAEKPESFCLEESLVFFDQKSLYTYK